MTIIGLVLFSRFS